MAVVLRSWCVVLCTVYEFISDWHNHAHNLHSWTWTYICPKHVELFMIINHNCWTKWIFVSVNISDLVKLWWLITTPVFTISVCSTRTSMWGNHWTAVPSHYANYSAYGTGNQTVNSEGHPLARLGQCVHATPTWRRRESRFSHSRTMNTRTRSYEARQTLIEKCVSLM